MSPDIRTHLELNRRLGNILFATATASDLLCLRYLRPHGLDRTSKLENYDADEVYVGIPLS